MVLEIIIYVLILSMMIVCINSLHKKGIANKLDQIYFSGLLLLIITQFVITILQLLPSNYIQTNESFPPLTPIYLGTLFTLTLIYILTRITVSSHEIQEDAHVWIIWAMFLVLVASFCTLLIGLPDAKTDLYRIPLALSLCIGMQYYPTVLDRFTRLKDAAENRTVEKNVERHKDVVINLVIESWRFAKNYERMIKRINTDQTQRYTRQLEQFVKKAEESLADVGLRVVNVEGYPYDPGMAVTPLNIEDFEPNDHLVVDKMLEPIIMEGTTLAKTGTVTLRRKE